jgi:hypothetical protein
VPFFRPAPASLRRFLLPNVGIGKTVVWKHLPQTTLRSYFRVLSCRSASSERPRIRSVPGMELDPPLVRRSLLRLAAVHELAGIGGELRDLRRGVVASLPGRGECCPDVAGRRACLRLGQAGAGWQKSVMPSPSDGSASGFTVSHDDVTGTHATKHGISVNDGEAATSMIWLQAHDIFRVNGSVRLSRGRTDPV